MKKIMQLKPVAAAIGTTFIVCAASSSLANTIDNPFGLTELSSGFIVAEEAGKCGTLCGGATPTVNKEGEMNKCASVCGEVQKCGTICGGVTDNSSQGVRPEGKDVEVVKCGSICAATTSSSVN